jgi:outer membrane protease
MKNITAFAVLVIILQAPAQALENSFSISPRFGLFYGQAEEIVYPPSGGYPQKSPKDFLSQLLWDMKPVYYYGISLDYSQTNPMEHWGFFSSLSIKTAIPGLSGTMEDRDWASRVNNDLTHYSSHDNFTDHILWVDVSAGLSFPLWSLFLLKVNTAFSYMSFGFSGMNGKAVYARETPQSGIYYPITDKPNLYTFEGKVISYSQQWFSFAPGISLEYYFRLPAYHKDSGHYRIVYLKTICLELFLQISPLNLCIDLDKHYARSLLYNDYLLGGLFFEPQAAIKFIPNEQIKVSLEASYRSISGTKGKAYVRILGTGADFVNIGEAGAGLSIFDFGLRTTIRL